jgi:cyanophycin synthetase
MNKKTIEITNVLTLRGPNIWTYRPVLEAWIDIGALEDFPSNTIPGLYERLVAWLPGLVEHRCGIGERGGFLQRLRDGTWPGHILEHVMIELQNLAGMQTGFGKARSTSTRGVYKVVVRARDARVSRSALYAARDLVMAAIEDQPYDVAAVVESLRDMVDTLCLGPSTGCIVQAATERRIPFFRLNDGNLVQFGYGARQRRIWTAETDQTSAIAESISSDKDLSKSLLRSCGVPVPEGRPAADPADAWEAACEIGLPVVVKPSDGNHGRGVSTNLTTQADVEAAWALAIDEGSEVLVERFIPGNEHRLLMVGGKLVAATRGESVHIIGDGRSTVEQLIASQINSDPRRGSSEDCPLNLILVDEADDPRVVLLELARQGHTTESIPADGEKILVQRNGNAAFDVTDLVHPSVAAAAALAARIVGLDIAGVDLVAEDISRPLEEQHGAIVEINAGPGLLMHLKPAEGKPRPVGRAIIDHLFAAGSNGRIPVVGISGSSGMGAVAGLLAQLLHLQGVYAGLACSTGLYLNQRRIEDGDCANWQSAHRILLNRAIEAAVFETGFGSILGEGLAYDRCQVGVVTNLDANAKLPEYHIDDAGQMANVLRTQVDVVLPDGTAVLNAADPRVMALAPLCDGEVMLFGASADIAALAQHRKNGGRAVFLEGARLVLATGMRQSAIATLGPDILQALPPTSQLEAILAATAAAWALGMPAEVIRAGIENLREKPAATGVAPTFTITHQSTVLH